MKEHAKRMLLSGAEMIAHLKRCRLQTLDKVAEDLAKVNQINCEIASLADGVDCEIGVCEQMATKFHVEEVEGTKFYVPDRKKGIRIMYSAMVMSHVNLTKSEAAILRDFLSRMVDEWQEKKD